MKYLFWNKILFYQLDVKFTQTIFKILFNERLVVILQLKIKQNESINKKIVIINLRNGSVFTGIF